MEAQKSDEKKKKLAWHQNSIQRFKGHPNIQEFM